MRQSDSAFSLKENKESKNATALIFLSIFFIYFILRLFAWKNTILFEDYGSLSKLEAIKVFLTFNLNNIINLGPDRALFYPFFGALFSLPGWSTEIGARLCSLFFSSLLFIAIAVIGKQIAKPQEVFLGLLVLSFSPVLISLSFAVLLEPSYIAMIYLGFWFFWTQHKNPKLWKAAVIGVVFGLSFLNRVEGILYLLIIPFLQGIYFVFRDHKYFVFKRVIAWTLIFIVFFSLLAIPQIWRVSHKMGGFAINGRQAWSLILQNPDGKSYDEKIYGLDYSPSQINLWYIQSHPEVWGQFVSNRPTEYIFQYLKTIIRNFNDLYYKRLGILIGPLGLIFFTFGLFALYQRGQRFETFLVLAFICFNLVAPFLHNVVIRHIAVIAPIIMLIEGIGIIYLSSKALEPYKNFHSGKYILPFIFLFCLISASAIPLLKTFKPPYFRQDYSLIELQEPVAIVKNISKKELLRPPRIAAPRYNYLAYFAEGIDVPAPYTDYAGLVKYVYLNNVDFLYLKELPGVEFPFYENFFNERPPIDFILLYSGKDPKGKKIELYRVVDPKFRTVG